MISLPGEITNKTLLQYPSDPRWSIGSALIPMDPRLLSVFQGCLHLLHRLHLLHTLPCKLSPLIRRPWEVRKSQESHNLAKYLPYTLQPCFMLGQIQIADNKKKSVSRLHTFLKHIVMWHLENIVILGEILMIKLQNLPRSMFRVFISTMYNFFNQLSVLQLLGEHPVCS